MPYQQQNYENLYGIKWLSDELLKNHFSLYAGYVTNTNKLLEALNNLTNEEKTGTPEFAELKRRFGWEFNGMRLHEYYFEDISSEPKIIDPNSELFKKLAEDFGSYDKWEKEFKSTGSMRGIGWVVLYLDKQANKLMNVWINEHDVGHLSGAIPLLVMDVFEHAYMVDYGIKKTDYIELFLKSIDWDVVSRRFGNSKTDFGKIPSRNVIDKTIDAIRSRGVKVEFVNSKEEALEKLVGLIPSGSEIMTAGSTTLNEIGFTDLLKNKNHSWINFKDEILSEPDLMKQSDLRKKSITSNYFVGSVHAVSETGEILIASASGSQIPPYAFSSDNVIWIVGVQKIVPNVEDGFRRIHEYCFPLEDKRMKSEGYPGSVIAKILLFEREIMPNRNVTLIFVNEKLGF